MSNNYSVRSRSIPRQVAWILGFLLLLAGCVLWHNWAYPALFDEDFSNFQWPPQGSVSPRSGVYVDWKDYQPILQPKCDNELLANRTLLIIVKSAADRAQFRHAVRVTWGLAKELHGFQVRTVFSIGRLNGTNDNLQKEHEKYGDLAVGDFVDSYHANTKKFLLQIKLASNYCGLGSALPYVFLVDDDHYVIIGNLIEEAVKHSPKEPLYMGWAQMSAPPMRYVWDKNYVSVSDYPYDKYPPFVSGGAVLLSQRTIEKYYSAIPRIKPFNWEDVYAGIIARILGIETLHNPNFRFKATGPGDPAMLTGIASHGYRLGEA